MKCRVKLVLAQKRLGFDQHRSLRGHVSEPFPAAVRRADHEIAEVGAEAIRAAKQFAIVKNAEAQAALDVDDEEVVETARLSEPVFGKGHEIDVAVDRSRARRGDGRDRRRTARRAR